MEESKIRALILEEIQGIVNQISEEAKGNYGLAAVAKGVSEIVAKRLTSLKDDQQTERGEDQDTEIGKDPI